MKVLRFESPPNRQECFIDITQIVAVVPCFCNLSFTDITKIIFKGGNEVDVYGNPKEIFERIILELKGEIKRYAVAYTFENNLEIRTVNAYNWKAALFAVAPYMGWLESEDLLAAKKEAFEQDQPFAVIRI